MVQVKYVVTTVVSHVIDAAAFTGIGYLAGHTINYMSSSLKSSFFPSKPFLDVIGGTVCCAIFIVIDQVARAILNLISKKLPENYAFKAQFAAVRIVGSGAAAIALTQVISHFNPTNFKFIGLPWQAGVVLLAVSGVAYTGLMMSVNYFDNRLQNPLADLQNQSSSMNRNLKELEN